MFRNIFYNSYVLFFLTGCKDQSKKNKMPELSTCDSDSVMFYHNPGNSRFFTMTKVYDKKKLSAIAGNINGKVISPADSCTTQGKIYYYGKADAVYIVYFYRAKDCMTVSFIKAGEKYFVGMREATKSLLNELQKTAKEPGSAINK